jgi:hypothetical protein
MIDDATSQPFSAIILPSPEKGSSHKEKVTAMQDYGNDSYENVTLENERHRIADYIRRMIVQKVY